MRIKRSFKRNLEILKMKGTLLVLGFAFVGIVNCAKAQKVYVGGVSNNRAVVWENGTPNYLTIGEGRVMSVLVVGKDVYAVGTETVSGKRVAKTWKNGVEQYALTDGTYDANATSIAVSGSDVYVVGAENSAGTIGKMWKNGIAQAGYNDARTLYSIFIDGSDVYVAGWNQNFKAAVWKNGTLLYTLTPGGGYHVAYSVVVDNGNVYTAGQEQINGNYTAKVWKNNAELYTLGTSKNGGFMNLFIFNGVIYVAGSGVNGGTTVAKLWTNGVGIDLSGGSNANAVFVSGSDVYVVGGANNSKALLWENGNLTTLSNGSAEDAYSVFAVGGGVGIAEILTTQVEIYPNPTNDKFTVEFDGIATIKLYDMLGKEVLTQTTNGKTEININHLPKGIYNIQLFSEGKVVGNGKIVKQ